MMKQLRRLVFGDSKVRAVTTNDVEPSELPPHLKEREEKQDRLSLILMNEAVKTAVLSSQIRQKLGEDVALLVQRR